jgi:3-hydroxyisobutyrate dehydrogenase
MSERIGFVGIGNMGLPLSLNLVRAGFRVSVYDVMPAGVSQVVSVGAVEARSLAELAAGCDVVICSLPSPVELEAVMYGSEGLLAHMRAGQNIIDMSTMDPAVTRKVAADAQKLGVGMLDAPVSGATAGARAGTLTIMVGGSRELLERYTPVLEAMGKKIVHTGDIGTGETVKLCNNLIASVATVAVAEAYELALRAGVDPKVLYEIVSQSTGQCWVHDKDPVLPGLVPGSPADDDFAPGFMVDLCHKDLGLAIATGRRYGASLVLTSTAHQMYAAASALGHGRQDVAAVKYAVEAMSKPI